MNANFRILTALMLVPLWFGSLAVSRPQAEPERAIAIAQVDPSPSPSGRITVVSTIGCDGYSIGLSTTYPGHPVFSGDPMGASWKINHTHAEGSWVFYFDDGVVESGQWVADRPPDCPPFSSPSPSASPSPSPSVSPSPSPSPSPSVNPSPSPSPSVVPSPSSLPSPSPSPVQTFTLTVTAQGPGALSSSTNVYPVGTVVVLTPQPQSGAIFTGWTADGAFIGWSSTLTVGMNADHTVVASFTMRPSFGDTNGVANEAIAQLAARGIINGCDKSAVPPLFCPDDPTLREQMAALIVRAMPGWADETGLPTFTDNTDDAELMTRVATLQRHNVVRGYQSEVCQARGLTPPCYGPLDTVTYGQALLFVARAMVSHGYWVLQPDDRSICPDQNGAVGANPNIDQQTLDHRAIVTYIHYAGTPPDIADVHAPMTNWATSVPRSWFARAFWQALDSYFGIGKVT